ncbi:hypothetical protein [Bradyrhizobium sp. CCBAU 11361]|nr:hypothetical protein [Bradyrhizobium sp. CCBAU 11361]
MPRLDFGDARNSQYLPLLGPGGAASPNALNFSILTNSGLLAAIGA